MDQPHSQTSRSQEDCPPSCDPAQDVEFLEGFVSEFGIRLDAAKKSLTVLKKLLSEIDVAVDQYTKAHVVEAAAEAKCYVKDRRDCAESIIDPRVRRQIEQCRTDADAAKKETLTKLTKQQELLAEALAAETHATGDLSKAEKTFADAKQKAKQLSDRFAQELDSLKKKINKAQEDGDYRLMYLLVLEYEALFEIISKDVVAPEVYRDTLTTFWCDVKRAQDDLTKKQITVSEEQDKLATAQAEYDQSVSKRWKNIEDCVSNIPEPCDRDSSQKAEAMS